MSGPIVRARRDGPAILLLSATLAACTGGGTMGRRSAAGAEGRLATQVVSEQWRIGGGSAALAAQPGERILVRHGALSLHVERPADVPPRATALVTALGGYVQTSSEVTDDGIHLVLRVPAPSLDAVMDSLARLGRVRSRTVRADDVTEQVVDVEARLASLRGARDRLRELQGRATAVAELVAAEGELARVQGELDALEARLKFLRGTVTLAELTLDAERAPVLGPLGVLFVGIGRLVGKLFVIR